MALFVLLVQAFADYLTSKYFNQDNRLIFRPLLIVSKKKLETCYFALKLTYLVPFPKENGLNIKEKYHLLLVRY